MRALAAFACILPAALAHAEPPSIAPADVVATVTTATATVDAAAVAGRTTFEAWIDAATPADIQAVGTALGKAFAIVASDVRATDATWTVETSSGARAIVALGSRAGRLYVTLKPVTTTKAPGRCVKVPARRHRVDLTSSGVDQRGEYRTATIPREMTTRPVIDVDGDAILDVFVPLPPSKHACPEAVSYRVYVMRGRCGHDLGVVGPGTLAHDTATADLDASGYRPLVLASEKTDYDAERIPEMTTTTRGFAVTKGRYTKRTETTATGRCHHCGVWHCLARP